MPPPDLAANEPNRRELLLHFQPSLNAERIAEVNDLLQELHQQAVEKRFGISGDQRHNKTRASWDLKAVNPTPASLSDIDGGGNVTVDVSRIVVGFEASYFAGFVCLERHR